MDGLKDRTLPDRVTRGGKIARAEPGGDLPERAARLDLRPAPAVLILRRGSARIGALRFEPLEPRPVDRLKRELEVKTLLGRGVEVARGPERAITIEVCPVALKTEQSGTGHPRPPPIRFRQLPAWQDKLLPCAKGPPCSVRSKLQRFAAGRAQRFRSFALQLATREGNPFIRHRFKRLLGHAWQCMRWP